MSAFSDVLLGVPNTLMLTGGALAIGASGGAVLAVGRQSRLIVVRIASRAVIELLRGIPPLVWIFIIFFGIGASAPNLTPFTAALLGLGAISSAYMAEIYRGGLLAIPKGQWEAASSLSLPRSTVWTRVIAPQVIRVSLPAAATYAIGLLKDSSVAYAIGVSEIMFYANQRATTLSDATGPFLVAAGFYLVLTVPLAWAARRVDRVLRGRVAQ